MLINNNNIITTKIKGKQLLENESNDLFFNQHEEDPKN
jgi:hypothetical protein